MRFLHAVPCTSAEAAAPFWENGGPPVTRQEEQAPCGAPCLQGRDAEEKQSKGGGVSHLASKPTPLW